jgi:hypothetical protein
LKKGPNVEELKWLEKQQKEDALAYVYGLHQLGKNKEALDAYNNLLKSSSDYITLNLYA